jgi:Na+/H+ antiporter NhaC
VGGEARGAASSAGAGQLVPPGRPRRIAASILFLATFVWTLLGPPGGTALALWPSLLAIALAFLTRDVLPSLLLGAFAGAILLRGGDPLGAFLDLFQLYLLPGLVDRGNVNVLVFTLLMGGLVELLESGGGMAAAAARLAGRRPTRRRAGLAVFGIGLLTFLDGLADTVLLGKALKPLADRVGMSRQKLAFLVDSTSTPVAGLSLISTWVAYELSLLRSSFDALGAGPEVSPFLVLAQSLPYRFYNLFLLLVVFLVVWLGRDVEPMRRAEQAVLAARPTEPTRADSSGRAWPVVTTLVALVLGVVGGLWLEGGGLDQPLSWQGAIEAVGAADAAQVFVWATAGAAVLGWLLLRVSGARQEPAPVEAFSRGVASLFLPSLILVFAWMLNAVIQELGAASYLAGLLDSSLPAAMLPAAVFALASLMSFSTGTSWGTMALMVPLVMPAAAALSGYQPPDAPPTLLIATVGAVLAGAVFGDHITPISDTTVLSAVTSGTTVMDHVRTQLPYALFAGGAALALGYLPAGFGVTPWVLLPLGAAACWAWVRWVGKRLD